MLSGMDKTCYVRYPDDDKDDPSKPGEPNRVIEISAHKLDDYRARRFVQCDQDGAPVKNPIPRVSSVPEGGLATSTDDPVAVEIQAEADGDPPPKAKAPVGGGSTGGNA